MLRERGIQPACVADLARLRAMKREIARGATFVWFADLDVRWVRQVKAACSQTPEAAFGHVIATQQGLEVSRSGRIACIKKGLTAFLCASSDFRLAATPFRVTSRTPLVDALLARMEVAVERAQPYLVFMNALQDCVLRYGLIGAYHDPHVFCAVRGAASGCCLKPAGPKNSRRLESIMKTAIGVSALWQSGIHSTACSQTLLERGAHDRVQPGSLWSKLLERLCSQMDQPKDGNGGLRKTDSVVIN